MAAKFSAADKEKFLQEARLHARQYRRELGLGDEPIADIFDLIERQGIILVRYPIPSEKLSAMIARESDEYLIFINSNMSLGHQIFSAGHELHHYRYDRDNLQAIACNPISEPNDPAELMANYFSGEFLMPEETVRATWKRFGKMERILPIHVITMACTFKVSFAAMLYTLLKLKLIPGSVYGKLKKLSQPENEELLTKYYSHIGAVGLIKTTQSELSKAFIEAANSNYANGLVSYKKLESLLNPWDKTPEDIGIEYNYGVD